MTRDERLQRLYVEVTEAICAAESASPPPGAYARIAILEERIALLLPASDAEGEIARLGAVQAWLEACRPEDARSAADMYLDDPLSEAGRRRLVALRAKAHDACLLNLSARKP